MELRVRLIRDADIPQVKELQDESFPITYSSRFYENIRRSNYLSIIVYEKTDDGERIIGISTCRQFERHSFPCGQKVAYLSTFCVRKEHRQHGIGGYLLALTCLISKVHFGCYGMSLHTETKNSVAINFYKKHGFNVTEFLPHFYTFSKERPDAVFMFFDMKDVTGEFMSRYSITCDEEIIEMLNTKKKTYPNPMLFFGMILVTVAMFLVFLKKIS